MFICFNFVLVGSKVEASAARDESAESASAAALVASQVPFPSWSTFKCQVKPRDIDESSSSTNVNNRYEFDAAPASFVVSN